MGVDLDKPIEFTKEADVRDSMEAIRASLLNVQRDLKGVVPREALERAVEDIKATKEMAEQAAKDALAARELAKVGAKTIPASKLAVDRTLEYFPRHARNKPDPEQTAFHQSEQRAFFDFLSADPSEVRMVLSDEAFAVYNRARSLNDILAFINAGIAARYQRDPVGMAEWQGRGGIKAHRLYKLFSELVGPFQRAMATTNAGQGLEWVPSQTATTLVDDIRQPISVTGQFQVVNLPWAPYTFPVQGLQTKSRLVAENATIGARNISTLNMQFAPKKHGGLFTTSSELEEDSIVAVAAMIRSEAVWCMNAGLADAIINGQLTSIVDTAWGLAGDAGDIRNMSDGLRYDGNLLAASTRVDSLGTVAADPLAQVGGLMGKNGNSPQSCFWLTGYLAYAKLLTLRDASGWAVVLTADKTSGRSTFETGVLGTMFGSSLIVESDFPQNMNSVGLVTNLSDNKTALLKVDTRGYRLGVRRGVTVDASREYLYAQDGIAFRVTGRHHFKRIQPIGTNYRFVGSLVNISTI